MVIQYQLMIIEIQLIENIFSDLSHELLYDNVQSEKSLAVVTVE